MIWTCHDWWTRCFQFRANTNTTAINTFVYICTHFSWQYQERNCQVEGQTRVALVDRSFNSLSSNHCFFTTEGQKKRSVEKKTASEVFVDTGKRDAYIVFLSLLTEATFFKFRLGIRIAEMSRPCWFLLRLGRKSLPAGMGSFINIPCVEVWDLRAFCEGRCRVVCFSKEIAPADSQAQLIWI